MLKVYGEQYYIISGSSGPKVVMNREKMIRVQDNRQHQQTNLILITFREHFPNLKQNTLIRCCSRKFIAKIRKIHRSQKKNLTETAVAWQLFEVSANGKWDVLH